MAATEPLAPSPKPTLEAEVQQMLTELESEVKTYLFETESETMKNSRLKLIDSTFQILQIYGLSPNQIFQNNPNSIKTIFMKESARNELLELLLKKGFNVNAATSDGLTPLYLACEAGNTNITKYLLQHGALSGQRHNGHTAAGEASIDPKFDITQLENDAHCKEFVEQYHLVQDTMFLAHRWSIQGSGRLGEDIFDRFTYSHPIVLRNSLARSFLEISRSDPLVKISDTEKVSFSTACKQMCPNLNPDDIKILMENVAARFTSSGSNELKNCAEKIMLGETCPIGLSTLIQDEGHHHEGLVFFDKNKVIRVNRGGGSRGRTGLEMNEITAELELGIRQFFEHFDPHAEVDARAFHADLEKRLGLKKIRLIAMKAQVSPTCKWVSEKAMLCAVMYGELLSLFKKKGLDPKVADENAWGLARSWYKAITIQDRHNMVRTLLDRFPDKTVFEMPMLIKEILNKICDKAVVKEKYNDTIDLMANKGMLEFYDLNEKFIQAIQNAPDFVTPAEGEEHPTAAQLKQYIERGALGCLTIDRTPILATLIDKGYDNAVKMLLERGASPNPSYPAFESILEHAIRKEKLPLIELFLAHGAETTMEQQKEIDAIKRRETVLSEKPVSMNAQYEALLEKERNLETRMRVLEAQFKEVSKPPSAPRPKVD